MQGMGLYLSAPLTQWVVGVLNFLVVDKILAIQTYTAIDVEVT